MPISRAPDCTNRSSFLSLIVLCVCQFLDQSLNVDRGEVQIPTFFLIVIGLSGSWQFGSFMVYCSLVSALSVNFVQDLYVPSFAHFIFMARRVQAADDVLLLSMWLR